jgi:DNA-binding GntR family transcriptional regulator
VITVEHKSLRETVTDALREMILTGELKGGERLIEDKLAERLGVSRNPVREAIRALESTGLVQVVPRHGAHVATVDAADAGRIQEIRRVLEAWIVTAAAERHDDDDLAAVDECLAAGQKASTAGDRVAESAAHRSFHMALEAATKNEYVSVVMEPLRQRTELVFSIVGDTVQGRDGGSPQWQEHQAIRDAIATRDSVRARELIDAHIDAAMRRYGQPEAESEAGA